jgi:hypothetical protein
MPGHALASLVYLVLALAVLGAAFGLLQKIVTDATFLLLIRVVVIVGVVLWIMGYFFGVAIPLGHGHA